MQWVNLYPLLARAAIFCESADKLFRQALTNELRRQGLVHMQVLPAYKRDGILDRIRLQNILINAGRLKIAAHMTEWFRALEDATWSSKEYEQGEWVRVDDGSYPVDCLDSMEYGVQPYKDRLLKAI